MGKPCLVPNFSSTSDRNDPGVAIPWPEGVEVLNGFQTVTTTGKAIRERSGRTWALVRDELGNVTWLDASTPPFAALRAQADRETKLRASR